VKKLARFIKIAALNVVILGTLFFLLEGAAHVLLLAQQVRNGRVDGLELAEVHHTEYDTLLGWVNRPSVVLSDHYGPGVGLTTNARGFRATPDFEDVVPEGRVRVVCVGDSFTLGFGVGDNDTWCRLLGERVAAVETVNMGQGGYGIDQAYLWYTRDADFEHDIVLFAFIGDDFYRMRRTQFLGYDKPVLEVSGDSVMATNVPVPTASFERAQRPRWQRALPDAIGRLNLATVLRSVGNKVGLGTRGAAQSDVVYDAPPRDEDIALVRATFRTLNRTVESRGGRMVAVYLPETLQYDTDPMAEWTAAVRDEARAGGWAFWDLANALKSEHPQAAASIYIGEGEGGRPGAVGHFNVRGNDLVANELAARVEDLLLPRAASADSVGGGG